MNIQKDADHHIDLAELWDAKDCNNPIFPRTTYKYPEQTLSKYWRSNQQCIRSLDQRQYLVVY